MRGVCPAGIHFCALPSPPRLFARPQRRALAPAHEAIGFPQIGISDGMRGLGRLITDTCLFRANVGHKNYGYWSTFPWGTWQAKVTLGRPFYPEPKYGHEATNVKVRNLARQPWKPFSPVSFRSGARCTNSTRDPVHYTSATPPTPGILVRATAWGPSSDLDPSAGERSVREAGGELPPLTCRPAFPHRRPNS